MLFLSAQILSGKIFASEFKEEAKKQVLALKEQYNITPGLAVIIVGSNPATPARTVEIIKKW